VPEPTNLGLFVPPDKLTELEEIDRQDREEKAKVTRRMTFRWIGWGAIGAILGQWTLGFIFGFFWPQKVGAFGGIVNAATVDELKVGQVKMIREGKFYLTRVPEGFFALYWKCPHLGCTVPWKENDPVMGGPPSSGDTSFADKGRFNCPCHGSLYNRYGQIVQGPAPRPMDRFGVRIDGNKVLVDTGKVITRGEASPADAVSA
jgi:cytochrome b6-f complex iron-sulfur subunit